MKGAGTAPATGDAASVLKWSRRSGQDLIDHYVSDPILKGILAGQSGDHGMPPSQVSAFVHAGITNHYFNGGYSPEAVDSPFPGPLCER